MSYGWIADEKVTCCYENTRRINAAISMLREDASSEERTGMSWCSSLVYRDAHWNHSRPCHAIHSMPCTMEEATKTATQLDLTVVSSQSSSHTVARSPLLRYDGH